MNGDQCPDQHEREPAWHEKVELIHRALAEAGVPHAFGGAIAMNYHREPRATLDIDINIFLRPAERVKLFEASGSFFQCVDTSSSGLLIQTSAGGRLATGRPWNRSGWVRWAVSSTVCRWATTVSV